MSTMPEPPVGSTDAAARLWREVLDQDALDEHETALRN